MELRLDTIDFHLINPFVMLYMVRWFSFHIW
jgi:hypothetical protein